MQHQIIEHKNIDKTKWDEQLRACINNNIYAQSWYLDAVSPGWKAIIIGNNEAFIPLTIKKKYGFLKLWVQPPFCQQLGVYCTDKFDLKYLKIIEQIAKKFIKTHIHLNAFNPSSDLQSKPNYILSLNLAYSTLKSNYSKDARKNIRPDLDYSIKEEELTEYNFENLWSLYKTQYGEKIKLSSMLKLRLKTLLFSAQKMSCLKYITYLNSENATLYSAALLFFENRIYYLFGAPSNQGRSKNITHYFINDIIEKNAEQALILDFEGSAIPSVAAFYKKWGTKEESYPIFKSGISI